MDRKIGVALATILGFSTACSTAKTAKSAEDPQVADSTTVSAAPQDTLRMVSMYGVRIPGRGYAIPLSEVKAKEAAQKEQAKEAEEQQKQLRNQQNADNYDPADAEQEEPDYD